MDDLAGHLASQPPERHAGIAKALQAIVGPDGESRDAVARFLQDAKSMKAMKKMFTVDPPPRTQSTIGLLRLQARSDLNVRQLHLASKEQRRAFWAARYEEIHGPGAHRGPADAAAVGA